MRLTMKSTIGEDCMVCPVCKYEDYDVWELFTQSCNGDSVETECPNCGARLCVTIDIVEHEHYSAEVIEPKQ